MNPPDGLVSGNEEAWSPHTDAIIQALRVFNEKVTEQDSKSAQLGNIQRIEQ
jgi:hypothetical protein